MLITLPSVGKRIKDELKTNFCWMKLMSSQSSINDNIKKIITQQKIEKSK